MSALDLDLAAGDPGVVDAQQGRWSTALRALARNPSALLGAVAMLVVVVVAVAAPLIAPFDPTDQDVIHRLVPPLGVDSDGFRHLLGTDPLGRDILSRTMYGARVALVVGFCAVAIGGGIGVTLGLVAGYYGGSLDALIMRVADLQLALPFIVLAIAIMAVLGAGLVNVVVVLGVTSWMGYARIVRAEVLVLRNRDFIEASRALGAGDRRLVVRHILPNITGSLVVIATFEVARRILAEASLSYLGLGVQPPTPAWGSMVADGREYLSTSAWVSTVPGLATVVLVLALNLLGDFLREVLDPRVRA